MRKFLTITALTALLLALPVTVVKAQPEFGGTITYGLWLEKGHRATTAQTAGVDLILPSNDSARTRFVSRTGYLRVTRDVGEIQGAFEVMMLQRIFPLGRSVDTYAQSGLGGFNRFVIDGDDEMYLLGVFEVGINIISIISLGVGTNVIFQDEANQWNLYGKLDFMAMPF